MADRRHDFALGAAVDCEQLEQRDWHDRLVQNLCQGFDRSEPDTQAGERSGAGNYDEGVDLRLAESVVLEQGRDLRDQLRREHAARERYDLEDLYVPPFSCTREGDVAVSAGGVGDEKEHLGFCRLIRGDP